MAGAAGRAARVTWAQWWPVLLVAQIVCAVALVVGAVALRFVTVGVFVVLSATAAGCALGQVVAGGGSVAALWTTHVASGCLFAGSVVAVVRSRRVLRAARAEAVRSLAELDALGRRS